MWKKNITKKIHALPQKDKKTRDLLASKASVQPHHLQMGRDERPSPMPHFKPCEGMRYRPQVSLEGFKSLASNQHTANVA